MQSPCSACPSSGCLAPLPDPLLVSRSPRVGRDTGTACGRAGRVVRRVIVGLDRGAMQTILKVVTDRTGGVYGSQGRGGGCSCGSGSVMWEREGVRLLEGAAIYPYLRDCRFAIVLYTLSPFHFLFLRGTHRADPNRSVPSSGDKLPERSQLGRGAQFCFLTKLSNFIFVLHLN